MSASTIRAGGAFVEFFGKDAGLKKAMSSVSSGLQNIGRIGRQVGIQMTAVGAAISAPFILGARQATIFEKGMANISTLLGDIDVGRLPEVSDALRQVARDTGSSFVSLQSSLFDFISDTGDLNESLVRLNANNRLAIAGNTTAAIAAEALTKIMAAYGDEVSGAADATDFLFKTAKVATTSFAAFAPQVGRVVGLSKQAGITLEEFGGAFAVLSKQLGTAQGFTALSGIFAAFIKPSAEAVKTAKKFGFEMNTATIKAIGLQGVLKKLADAGASVQDLGKIFTERLAISGVGQLIASGEQFGNFVKELGDRAGATDKAFKKMSNTLAFLFGQLGASFTDVLISLGDAVAGILKVALPAIQTVLKAVSDFIKDNKELAASVALIGAAMVVLGPIVAAVATVIGSLGFALAGIGIIAANIVIIMKVVGVAIGLMATIFISALIAIAAVFSGIFLSEFVLGFDLIEGGILKTIGNFRIFGVRVKTLMLAAWKGIQVGFLFMVENIIGFQMMMIRFTARVAKFFVTSFIEAFRQIGRTLITLPRAIFDIFNKTLGVLGSFATFMVAGFLTIKNRIVTIFSSLPGIMKSIFASAGKLGISAFQFALKGSFKLLEGLNILADPKKVAKDAQKIVKEIGTAIKTGSLEEGLLSGLDEISFGLEDVATGVIDDVTDKILEVLESTKGIIAGKRGEIQQEIVDLIKNDLLKEIDKQTKGLPRPPPPPGGGGGGDTGTSLEAMTGQVSTSAVGSFSAAALGRLRGTNEQKQLSLLAKNGEFLEKIERNTKTQGLKQ